MYIYIYYIYIPIPSMYGIFTYIWPHKYTSPMDPREYIYIYSVHYFWELLLEGAFARGMRA